MRTVNSWSHNLPSLVKGRMRCVLYIHPTDAEGHQIRNGDRVKVTSRVGAVEVPAKVTDAIMQGVVSLPHGYGHRGDGIALGRQAGAAIDGENRGLLLLTPGFSRDLEIFLPGQNG